VGCGEGHHTRRVAAALPGAVVAGVDVAKAAVAHAARANPSGFYAVASAADLPLADAAVDVALDVFGPVVPDELARVVRSGGLVVAVHPGPRHLDALRRLVYAEARPHEVKDPLRSAGDQFERIGSETVRFGIVTADARDLWAMTPYRWHAPPDIETRLLEASARGFETEVDVVVTAYRRRP
jgi:23S rRNA (guanine745-N1)-methyltransferase